MTYYTVTMHLLPTGHYQTSTILSGVRLVRPDSFIPHPHSRSHQIQNQTQNHRTAQKYLVTLVLRRHASIIESLTIRG